MKIVVVGGGTAGTVVSTYFKSYWGDRADITVVYDHKQPGIGVGESLTPVFDAYLKAIGVSTHDLIKNCNATIKLGLKFKDWTKPGHHWHHSFPLNECLEQIDSVMFGYNAISAYDILHKQNDEQYNYGNFFFNNNLIPKHNDLNYRHALHIDATLLGKYLESKFKNRIRIIDGIVEKVNMHDGEISSIVLKDGTELTADIYVDASGYERVLIKNFNPRWVDISNDLPTDRTIPNPAFVTYDFIPPYTTAEATKNGWILDVPLSNRRGTGYVYSSKFTTDEEAREDFNKWLVKTHNIELTSNRVIKFSNGYYETTWNGNCIAMGLSSGFVEPLEATSIHHLIIQMDNFVRLFQGKHLEFDRKTYNTIIREVYENSFNYIRFFYNTNRRDSDFWNYLTDNKPDWIKVLEEKLKYSFLTSKDIPNDRFMFESTSFNCVAYGHGLYDDNRCLKQFLDNHGLYEAAARYSKKVRDVKNIINQQAIDHKAWIDFIKSNPSR